MSRVCCKRAAASTTRLNGHCKKMQKAHPHDVQSTETRKHIPSTNLDAIWCNLMWPCQYGVILKQKKHEEISRCSGWAGRTPTRQSAIWPAPSSSCNVTQPLTAETNNSMLEGLENTMKYTISAWQHKRSGTWAGCILRMSLYVLEAGHVSSV